MTEPAGPSRRVLLITGSLRADGYTTRLLHRAATYLPAHWAAEAADVVRPLPHYDADHEGEHAPGVVRDMRARVGAADGLLIATPEYNLSMPGGMKNWVDWASRPLRAHALIAKPVAVLGASPSPRGAQGAVSGLTSLLGLLGARVAGDGVTVAGVHEKLGPDGTLDPDVDEALRALVARFVDLVDAPVSDGGGG